MGLSLSLLHSKFFRDSAARMTPFRRHTPTRKRHINNQFADLCQRIDLMNSVKSVNMESRVYRFSLVVILHHMRVRFLAQFVKYR